MAISMEKKLTSGMKKLMNKQIDNNVWMKKLIEFYEEEMGSDSDADRGGKDDDISSVGSLSSDVASEPSKEKPKKSKSKAKKVVSKLPSSDASVSLASSSVRSKSEEKKKTETYKSKSKSSKDEAKKVNSQSIESLAVSSSKVVTIKDSSE